MTLTEFKTAVEIYFFDAVSDKMEFLKDFLLNNCEFEFNEINGKKYLTTPSIKDIIKILKVAHQNSFYQNWGFKTGKALEKTINFLEKHY